MHNPPNMKPLHNPKSLQPLRKQLRRNLTPAEASLWNHLKNSKLDGKKFRRQHGIGRYIVDFYCPECRVIVELDGAVHKDVLRAERDWARERFLTELGIKIVRFENREVFEDIESVLERIRQALHE